MSPTRRPKSRVSILIGDREAVFRFGLTKLFGLEDDLRVVAQAENSGQVLSLTKTFRPDMVLVQAEIVNESGDNLLARVGQISPRSKFVVVANSGSNSFSVFSLDPATGFLTPAGTYPSALPDPVDILITGTH